jgi:hypothetical protein
MRRALIVLSATALVIGLTTASAASDEKWARGKVTEMAGDTLTVDVKGQSMTFTVDKTTQIIKTGAGTKAREMAKEGKAPTLADLVKVGDSVEVSYTETDGKMLAKVVRPGVSAPAMTSEEGAKEVKGVVSDVSGTSLSIKSEEGEEMTFAIDPKTQVIGHGLGTMAREKKAEGEGVKLTDAVAKGDSVEVKYKAMGEMKHAVRVHVLKKGT